MSNENKNIKRIQSVNRTLAATDLDPKMIGLVAGNRELIAKFADDADEFFTPEGGNASFNSLAVTGFSVAGNVQVDINGNLFVGEIDVPIDWTLDSSKVTDFTADHRVSYSIDTSAGVVLITVPDAVVGALFETQFLKSSSIITADIIVQTVSGQLIGGKASQSIYGQSESFWIKSTGLEYEVFQDARNKLQDALARSTTILSGFGVTTASATTVDISEGLAGIDDPTAGDKSITVRFAGVAGLPITGLATRGYTVLGFDPDTGLIDQHSDTTTAEHQITHPRVGIVLHSYGDGTIQASETWWTVGQNPSTRHSALLDFFKVLKDGVQINGVAGTNTVSVSSGKFLSSGLNGDENLKAPDLATINPLTQSQAYIYADRTTTIGAGVSPTVDYSQWDSGGVLTPVGSQKWYNYRVFIPIAGVADNANNQELPVIWQYAQNEWGSSTEAKAALSSGDDTFSIMPKLIGVTALCAIVTVRGGATNLDAAIFRQTDMFGGVASSSGGAVVGGIFDVLGTGEDAGEKGIKNARDAVDLQDYTTFKQLKIGNLNSGTGNDLQSLLNRGCNVINIEATYELPAGSYTIGVGYDLTKKTDITFIGGVLQIKGDVSFVKSGGYTESVNLYFKMDYTSFGFGDVGSITSPAITLYFDFLSATGDFSIDAPTVNKVVTVLNSSTLDITGTFQSEEIRVDTNNHLVVNATELFPEDYTWNRSPHDFSKVDGVSGVVAKLKSSQSAEDDKADALADDASIISWGGTELFIKERVLVVGLSYVSDWAPTSAGSFVEKTGYGKTEYSIAIAGTSQAFNRNDVVVSGLPDIGSNSRRLEGQAYQGSTIGYEAVCLHRTGTQITWVTGTITGVSIIVVTGSHETF